MNRLDALVGWWNAQSLARQFLLAGGLVSAAGAVVVAAFVTVLIERAVTHYAGVNTALYVDSVIAPLLPDMRRTTKLEESVAHALDETLAQGALGRQLRVFRLWRPDGLLLYSSEKQYEERHYLLNGGLRAALAGQVVAEFDDLHEDAIKPAQGDGEPLLEIYNPVRQPWSGEVVAVSEFYEVAPDLQASLMRARLLSWSAVVLVTLVFFLSLSAIVLRGSRTIERQRGALRERVGELSRLLAENKLLNRRVRRASQRAAALNESYLRRIGADLHDGPAQLVALAALRLDGAAPRGRGASASARRGAIDAVRRHLDEALHEIRTICSGLVLPQVEGANLRGLLARAVAAHEQRSGVAVALEMSDAAPALSEAEKTCIYRFVQETLNNGWRHGSGAGLAVRQAFLGDELEIAVTDRGPGFDPEAVPPGSLGLAGMRERIESLGGRFGIESSREGTRVWMTLKVHDMEKAQWKQSA